MWPKWSKSCSNPGSISLCPVCDIQFLFFLPVDSFLDLTTLTGRIIQDSLQAQQLRSMAAVLESSAICDTRELQSVCADLLSSSSIEQVSYLFNPPLVLENLANIDRDALDKMEKVLLQSGYFPGSLPAFLPQARPSTETDMPGAGHSSTSHHLRPSTSSIPLSSFSCWIRLLKRLPEMPKHLRRTNSPCPGSKILLKAQLRMLVRTPPKMPPKLNVHTTRRYIFVFLCCT